MIGLIVMIIVMTLCLTATTVYLLAYIGLFKHVDVTVGKPEITNIWIAYKLCTGSYSNCLYDFVEASSIYKDLPNIAIFYDNLLDKSKQYDLRYAAGLILSESKEPDEEQIDLMKRYGYKIAQLPAIDHSVKASTLFFTSSLSSYIASHRVFPAMYQYISSTKLSAHPVIQLCFKDVTHFMAPLSQQKDFFVDGIEYVYK